MIECNATQVPRSTNVHGKARLAFVRVRPEGRERLDPLWDERTPMPSAAQAVYRALIVLAEKRLNEMDEQEGANHPEN